TGKLKALICTAIPGMVVDMPADERTVLGKDLWLTIGDHVRVRHFAAALGRNGEHGGNAAIDVNKIIALIRTRLLHYCFKLIALVLQEDGQFFNLQRTLMNG